MYFFGSFVILCTISLTKVLLDRKLKWGSFFKINFLKNWTLTKKNPTLIIIGYEQCQVLFNLLLVRIILETRHNITKNKRNSCSSGAKPFFKKLLQFFGSILILFLPFISQMLMNEFLKCFQSAKISFVIL
jgi:hypothetical protein